MSTVAALSEIVKNLVTNHKEKEQTDWAELYHETLIFNEKELNTGNLTSTILQNG